MEALTTKCLNCHRTPYWLTVTHWTSIYAIWCHRAKILAVLITSLLYVIVVTYPSYPSFHSELSPLHLYLFLTTYPMPTPYPTSDLPYATLHRWPTLCCPTLELPYTALHQTCPTPVTYPMLLYARPTLCHPTSDLPYIGNLSYAALCQTYPTLPYVGDLSYAALCQWPT